MDQIDRRALIPLLEQWLSVCQTATLPADQPSDKRRGSRKPSSPRVQLPRDVSVCVRQLIVSIFAHVGPSLLDEVVEVVGVKSALFVHLTHLQTLMPTAPYSHSQSPPDRVVQTSKA
ncbi:hypothetical protein AHF37_03765 [Paragonimus kellicotti]|nr:hypothetical protein AHF37_03765 [Paragonimus kellicotti]